MSPKTLRAVFHPEEFEPFPGLTDAAEFGRMWAENRACVLANLAHAAYLDKAPLTEVIRKIGAPCPELYNRHGAQAFLVVWHDMAVLSFRGSEPSEGSPAEDGGSGRKGLSLWACLSGAFHNDVVADLRFRKVALEGTPGAKIHRGFLREIDKLWEPLILKDLGQIAGIPVWVTGHSLGAAMATLAAMRHPFEGVVTFGSPRVGRGLDGAFQASGHRRFVNGSDPVPRLPPKLFGYRHHAPATRIGDPDGGSDFRYDHSIVYYTENLASGG